MTVYEAGPGEDGAEEIIDVLHKVYLDFVGELGVKQFLLVQVRGVEQKIVNIDPSVKRRTSRQQEGAVGRHGVLDDDGEDAEIVKQRSKFEFSENGGEHFVPVMGATTESVEGLVERLSVIFVLARITDWRSNVHALVVWESCLAEGVFAVALLEDALVLDRFGDEKAETGVLQNRSVAFRLGMISIFVIVENKDAGLDATWVTVFVVFDANEAH